MTKESAGLIKIWDSAKAMFAVVLLIFATIVALVGKMDPAYAACVATIGSVFMYVRGKNQDVAAQTNSQNSVTSMQTQQPIPIPPAPSAPPAQGMSQGPPAPAA